MTELAYGGKVLARIHRARNEEKLKCYLTGFLEGIAASGEIERLEREPLEAQCRDFARNVGEPDAVDIIEDLDADLLDHDALLSITRIRMEELDPTCNTSAFNRFFGFCAGIACDGVITSLEATRLTEAMEASPSLQQHHVARAIYFTCKDALLDGEIDQKESQEIGGLITQLVGDSYNDTGLSSLGGVPIFEEDITVLEEEDLDGKLVVLTGESSIAARKIRKERVRELGSITSKSVSAKTDVVFVAMEAARDWKYTHMGGKLKKAIDLRQASARPAFASETTLLKAIGFR